MGLRKAIWSAGREDEEAFMDAPGVRGEGTKGGEDRKPQAEKEEEGALNDEDVVKLEQMMRKLQAVRDLSSGLPEEQRKRMAARAVGEVMKEL